MSAIYTAAPRHLTAVIASRRVALQAVRIMPPSGRCGQVRMCRTKHTPAVHDEGEAHGDAADDLLVLRVVRVGQHLEGLLGRGAHEQQPKAVPRRLASNLPFAERAC